MQRSAVPRISPWWALFTQTLPGPELISKAMGKGKKLTARQRGKNF